MCFISNSPGGYAMYRLNPLKFHPGLHEEVDARTDVLHMDDFLRTKISRMQRLPNISYPWCFAARAWLARAPLSFYFIFRLELGGGWRTQTANWECLLIQNDIFTAPLVYGDHWQMLGVYLNLFSMRSRNELGGGCLRRMILIRLEEILFWMSREDWH